MTEDKRKYYNEYRLRDVLAALREKALLVIADLEKQGLRPLVTCGFRSIKEQNALYALGRTKRGKIVTYAKGGESKHNHGRAVDFAFLDKAGNIDWDIKLFKKLGVAAKLRGLNWGGDWKKFQDNPHLELK